MAIPPDRDIYLYRGDVYIHEFTFVDSNDDPIDLSTFTITAQTRRRADATAAVDFAVDDTDAADGLVIISLTPEQTEDLRSGVYDLQVSDAGEPVTLIRGKLTITKDVTRP